jgi:hypothetical protein
MYDAIVKTLLVVQPFLKRNYQSASSGNGTLIESLMKRKTSTDDGERYVMNKNPSQCFEVLGFDVILDQNLKPWVLEVNHSPSLTCDSQIDQDIKESLLMDTVHMLGLAHQDVKNIKDDFGQWKQHVLNKEKKEATRRLAPDLTTTSSNLSDALQPTVEHTWMATEDVKCGTFERIYPSPDEKRMEKYEMYVDTATQAMALDRKETNASKNRNAFLREKRLKDELERKPHVRPKTHGTSPAKKPVPATSTKISPKLNKAVSDDAIIIGATKNNGEGGLPPIGIDTSVLLQDILLGTQRAKTAQTTKSRADDGDDALILPELAQSVEQDLEGAKSFVEGTLKTESPGIPAHLLASAWMPPVLKPTVQNTIRALPSVEPSVTTKRTSNYCIRMPKKQPRRRSDPMDQLISAMVHTVDLKQFFTNDESTDMSSTANQDQMRKPIANAASRLIKTKSSTSIPSRTSTLDDTTLMSMSINNLRLSTIDHGAETRLPAITSSMPSLRKAPPPFSGRDSVDIQKSRQKLSQSILSSVESPMRISKVDIQTNAE